jgi:GNAT superfamily N-acetyltransferase
MPTNRAIKVGPLRESDLREANRIFRLAFGTFLGLPDPMQFMGDRSLIEPRWHAAHVKTLAARDGQRLIGTNMLTRWGSFGFLGPLTVLPEYWNRGVGQRLMEATVKAFDTWGVNRSALFTFAQSSKHVGLYQKFGYWPQYLTALMMHSPNPGVEAQSRGTQTSAMLSTLPKSRREEAIQACARITSRIDEGLDLSAEIRAALAQRVGEVVLTYTRNVLDGFAVCMQGLGSEGGEKTCYIKFAAARSGAGTAERFERLLDACDALALSRRVNLEAGINLARADAYSRMRAHGYTTKAQGVEMQRPHVPGFSRTDAYVIDDLR